ncbi:MAG: hypothetical protein ACYTF5_09375 [Planctomycetota bacterium]
MRLFLYLLGSHCKSLVVFSLLGGMLVLVLGVFGQLAAGVAIATVLDPGVLHALLVAALPDLLSMVLPMALVHTIVRLWETRELQAGRALGIHPLWSLLALLLPGAVALPLVARVVHDARPAAIAQSRHLAARLVLDRRHVGFVGTPAGIRFLWGAGDVAVALTAKGLTVSPSGTVAIEAARVQIGDHRDAIRRGRCGQLRADLGRVARPLGQRSPRELSSRFLEQNPHLLAASREGSERETGTDVAVVVRRELWRRQVWTPTIALGLLLALLLALRRRPPGVLAYALWMPALVALNLFLPRLIAQ